MTQENKEIEQQALQQLLVIEKIERKLVFDRDKIKIGDIVKVTYRKNSWKVMSSIFGNKPKEIISYGIVDLISDDDLYIYVKDDYTGMVRPDTLNAHKIGNQYDLEVAISV